MLDVIIFEGNDPKSRVEEWLVRARHATLRDNLDKLLALPQVSRIFLVTNSPKLQELTEHPQVFLQPNTLSPAEFHFGRALVSLIEKYEIKAVLCLGGAAVPLITSDELAAACRKLLEKENRYITNNVQSADIIAWHPAHIVSHFPPPVTDNALALLLRFSAKFEQVLLPATLGTQFDIDTPADLLILAASPFGGPHLRAALLEMNFNTEPVKQLKQVLLGNYRDVALIGRIGAPAIARINHNLKVRLRIFSEERGMKALGRLERNEAVSLLGYWLEEIGPERFFAYLAKTVDAALIDTRVLFAHMKTELSDADRFWSDLGRYHEINDPFVRDFTKAAVRCGIPVLLGGHSLVTGCIYALVEEFGCQF